MIGPLLFVMFAVAEEPPRVGRPVDFSGVVGRFRIEADVSPKTVPVEDPLTLRVTIHGEAVTTPPTRGELRIFPEELDFFREDAVDEDRADPAAGTWTFVWRLRPKSTDVREVPALRLVYWSPMLRRFQAATTDPVPIEVRPAEAVKTPVLAPPVPTEMRFFDISPSTWDSPAIEIGVWGIALAIVGGLLVVEHGGSVGSTPPAAETSDRCRCSKHGGERRAPPLSATAILDEDERADADRDRPHLEASRSLSGAA